jgi:hypothetical protein
VLAAVSADTIHTQNEYYTNLQTTTQRGCGGDCVFSSSLLLLLLLLLIRLFSRFCFSLSLLLPVSLFFFCVR